MLPPLLATGVSLQFGSAVSGCRRSAPSGKSARCNAAGTGCVTLSSAWAPEASSTAPGRMITNASAALPVTASPTPVAGFR